MRLDKANQALAAAQIRAAQTGATADQQAVQKDEEELRTAQEFLLSFQKQSLQAAQAVMYQRREVCAQTGAAQNAEVRVRRDLAALHYLATSVL